MATLKEYFEMVGILLGVYIFIRTIVWMDDKSLGFFKGRPPGGKSSKYISHPIETAELKERLKTVREDFTAAKLSSRIALSTKAAQLQTKREEISKCSFFNKSQSALEPTEHDQPSRWMLTL